MHKCACYFRDSHMVSAAGDPYFHNLRHISPHLFHSLLISMIHALRIVHTQRHTAALLFLLNLISVYFYIRSQTELLMGQMIVGAEGPAAEDYIHVPPWRQVLLSDMCQALAHLALKQNGRWLSDWFNLCSGQNTSMTKYQYQLFAPFSALCSVK